MKEERRRRKNVSSSFWFASSRTSIVYINKQSTLTALYKARVDKITMAYPLRSNVLHLTMSLPPPSALS